MTSLRTEPFRRPLQHGVTDAHFVYNVTGGAGEKVLRCPDIWLFWGRPRHHLPLYIGEPGGDSVEDYHRVPFTICLTPLRRQFEEQLGENPNKNVSDVILILGAEDTESSVHIVERDNDEGNGAGGRFPPDTSKNLMMRNFRARPLNNDDIGRQHL